MPDIKYMEIKKQFPNVFGHTGNPDTYCGNLWITQGSMGAGYVDLWIQFTSAGDWDWWVTGSNCLIQLFIEQNGIQSKITSNNAAIKVGNDAYMGMCNMPGSGQNGVLQSPLTLFYSNYHVTDPNARIRMTVDCTVYPVIQHTWTPGYLDTGYVSGVWGDVQIGWPPSLSSIVNNNKYNNPKLGIQDYVSADMVTIDIKCNVADWGSPTAKVYWSCSDGQSSNTTVDTFRISNLKPGTSYKIDVYLRNDIGSSSTASITIRTRYEEPVVELALEDVDLEQLIFHWTSDKELAVTEYKIDDGEWVELGQTGLEGTFTAQWFGPKTTHTIYFRGISTPELDYLNSNETDASGTTHDRAHIVDIGDKIFGLPIDITIESESDKLLKMDIWTEGNNLEPHFVFDNIKAGDQVWTFNPTQDQLDQMYRTYPKSNEVPIHFLLTTHGEWKDWDDDQKDEILTLTGIAKTAHVGDSSNKPRRCQVWVGDEDDNPRRCVVWVGVNGESHRTI